MNQTDLYEYYLSSYKHPENVTLEYCRRMAVPFIRNLSNTNQVSNQVLSSQPDSETTTRRMKNKRCSCKEIVCFRCQRKGHTATISPAPAAVARNMAHMREESNLDITSGATVQKDMDYAMRLGPLDDESYWLGSGCTIHISNNKSHFDSFTPCDGFVEGIGAQCAVEGKGTITT
ncbi:hypothetical protein OGAPHI_007057 [Ogataea philodendri]|uniref:Uncharacterized protein n=1 Tax=Ogataea philodendri TaxID=1378263 RepID=A0A9P8T0D0_9ASCO|nr:uncharacterized protein OGAPHI_007057 [Ogataea philodendri]KAH3660471.1 hypothetical protein OGAPHI_007057 [Ogataea philodendri]